MSDRETLLSFGFTEARVNKALKVTKNAGLQPCLDWLEKNENDDGTMVEAAEGPEDDGEITTETANSLKCDDCGRLLRDSAAAEFHAAKTQHVNFSESTLAIKPLTAEEKAAKVLEMKERLARRREEKKQIEAVEAKQKETVRRTTGAEMQIIREKLETEQMAKELAERKRIKEADRIAKEAVKKGLEADKLERRLREEERKRLAAGQQAKPVAVSAPVTNNVASKDYTETRIQIRTPTGTITNVFQVTDTLSTVSDFIKKTQPDPFKLVQSFPRKVFGEGDFSKSLKDLGLVPSSALQLLPGQ